MVYIDGVKYACERCIRGHRVTTCKHTDQPLTMIKPKGRPATQCAHCREYRKSKSMHTRCVCGSNLVGNKHMQTCPCAVNPDLCSCPKHKYSNAAVTASSLHSGSRRRTASNPPPARKRAPSLLTSLSPVASSVHSPVSAPARSLSSTGLVELGKEQQQQTQAQTHNQTQTLTQAQSRTQSMSPSSDLFAFNNTNNNNSNNNNNNSNNIDDEHLSMAAGLASQLSSNQQPSFGFTPIFSQPYLSDFASGASSIDSDHDTTSHQDVVLTAGSTASSANLSVIPDDEYLQPIYGSDTVITSLFDPPTSLASELATIVGENPTMYDAVEDDDFFSALSPTKLDQSVPQGDIWSAFEKSMISM